jgi:hypothetical protein
MVEPYFVGGQAGAGKTRKLMEAAPAYWDFHASNEHQSLLALALMHGARKQLDSTLRKFCPSLPVTVSTIHSFALKTANRWRRSCGLTYPISVCDISCGLAQANGRTYATHDEILELACDLLQSPTVRETIAHSHPVVIVDEFQDCKGNTLKVVQALGQTSRLLLAADDFQLLFNPEDGCPAMDWVDDLKQRSAIKYETLDRSRRTEVPGILLAADCLRNASAASQRTVPVYCGYKPEMVAVRLVQRFTGWNGASKIGDGTCALITLSEDDPAMRTLLDSFKRQLARASRRQVSWIREGSEAEELAGVLKELEVNPETPAETISTFEKSPLGGFASGIARDVARHAKLRGLPSISHGLVIEFARVAVHNARAFTKTAPKFRILTVHGAKNREFDHVFILWSYKRLGWPKEQQRRLLYNAVTRAKIDCTVLFLGDVKSAQADPVLRLLGPADAAFEQSWTRGRTSNPGKRDAKRSSN